MHKRVVWFVHPGSSSLGNVPFWAGEEVRARRVRDVMVWERDVVVERERYSVVISDEKEVLLAKREAGRIVVGCLDEKGGGSFPGIRYLVESAEAVDEEYLERVVRRERGLPWVIGENEELRLREFTVEDIGEVPAEKGDGEGDRVFYQEEKLRAYIRSQYGFWEYGLWAVVRKADGRILGKAGLTACDGEGRFELAYHIFEPFRRQGYGEKACRMVLDYVEKEYGNVGVYAVTEASNDASAGLLRKLGFQLRESECNGARHRYYLDGPYC